MGLTFILNALSMFKEDGKNKCVPQNYKINICSNTTSVKKERDHCQHPRNSVLCSTQSVMHTSSKGHMILTSSSLNILPGFVFYQPICSACYLL
jgi:hypothetical protein